MTCKPTTCNQKIPIWRCSFLQEHKLATAKLRSLSSSAFQQTKAPKHVKVAESLSSYRTFLKIVMTSREHSWPRAFKPTWLMSAQDLDTSSMSFPSRTISSFTFSDLVMVTPFNRVTFRTCQANSVTPSDSKTIMTVSGLSPRGRGPFKIG